MNAAPLIRVSDASKDFSGFRAIDHVTVEVAAGSITAVIGPNGAGKSTLFNLITGKLVPTSGAVYYKGADITRVGPEDRVRNGFGRTFQRTSVFLGLSVADNLRTSFISGGSGAWSFFGSAASRFNAEVGALLARFGLEAKAGLEAGTLSHGDQKQLELAMALAQSPQVLLLDEPLAGMSPSETRQSVQTIVSEVRDRGITLLFTEHDIDVVFAIADVIVVLDKGKVVATGDPGSIRANARVKEVYLGTQEPVSHA